MKKKNLIPQMFFAILLMLFAAPAFAAIDSISVVQAETHISEDYFSNEYSGYNGYGYVEYPDNASGVKMNFLFQIPFPGSYEISIRYALESSSTSLVATSGSSTIDASLDFPSTGSWTTWQEVSFVFDFSNMDYSVFSLESIVNGGPIIDQYTIRANEPMQYDLSVNYGDGDGWYVAGEVINIEADAAPTGKVFDYWRIYSGYPIIADINDATTTLTMPSEKTWITAEYKDEAATWEQITYDDFNSSYGNWNDGGADCMRTTVNPIEGSHSVKIFNDNSSSLFTTDNLDLEGYVSVKINFDFRAEGTETGDQFILEYSSDGGNTFNEFGPAVFMNGATFENGIVYSKSITISSNLTDEFQFRLRSIANSYNDIFYFDNITIEALNDGTKSAAPLEIAETSIENNNLLSLSNYPNPFSSETTISYELAENSEVSVIVYNIYGQQISTLASNEMQYAGEHTITWNADNFDAGMYICVIKGQNEDGLSFAESNKMNLMK